MFFCHFVFLKTDNVGGKVMENKMVKKNFLDKTKEALKIVKTQKNVETYLQSLKNDERLALNYFLMTGQGELPEGSNLDSLVDYFMSKEVKDIEKLVAEALKWAAENKIFEDDNIIPNPDIAQHDTARQINLMLNVNDNIDPTRVIVLSRDITNSDRLTLQEINVDTGNYVPVPVGAVATILREYADTIERQQEEINSQGGF